MGDIPRAHHIHPLQLRPFPQVLEGQLFAGGPAVMGVEVKVGGEVHRRVLLEFCQEVLLRAMPEL